MRLTSLLTAGLFILAASALHAACPQAPLPLQAPPVKASLSASATACHCPETGVCSCGDSCDCAGCVSHTPTTRAATDGGPPWNWDTSRGVWHRTLPATAVAASYGVPVVSYRPAVMTFGGGGACVGGR